MNLEDMQREYRKVSREKLTVGALVITILSEDEGLCLNNGQKTRRKRIIIIGVDKDNDVIYGSVLINTKMNPRSAYSPEYLRTQYLLSESDYPDFLEYDSFADCAEIIAIPMCKLLDGEYYGTLKEEDLQGIFDLLETTETLTTKEKKRFGIRRR